MDITEEQFNALLVWLDENPEAAGRKYEIIRTGLTRIFVSRGFSDAEDLADLTIDRVITLLPGIRDTYIGDPAHFFHSVARYIILEAGRRPEIATDVIPEVITRESENSDQYECLLQCLELLSEERRELILEYYLYKGREKIEHRQRMAKERGITVSALRSRAHHLRDILEAKVLQRIKNF